MSYIHNDEADDSWNFRTDNLYPRRILLSTVLRWSLTGFGIYKSTENTQRVFRINDDALAILGEFLAKHIESGAISIHCAHTMLPIVDVVRNSIIERLRVVKWNGELPEISLVDNGGLRYHIDGMQLYQVVSASTRGIDKILSNSRFLDNLGKAMPEAWRNSTVKLAVNDAWDAA